MQSMPPLTARALSATALYAVMFRPNTDGRIATVQLRWEDPDTHQVTEINGNFNTWDLAASFVEASPHYQLAVIVAQYAELLRHSPWAARHLLLQSINLAPFSPRLTETRFRLKLRIFIKTLCVLPDRACGHIGFTLFCVERPAYFIRP